MVSIADFASDDDHPQAFVLVVHVSLSLMQVCVVVKHHYASDHCRED